MTSKFEQLIEYVINDEEQKARELFHDIVVEKSREIYENLMQEEAEEELDEAKEEEGEEEELDESAEEELDEGMEDMDETMGGDASEQFMDEVEVEEEGMMEEGGEEGHEEGLEDRVVDLEDKLDELMAEFEAMMGDEKAEHGDDFGVDGGDALEVDDTEEFDDGEGEEDSEEFELAENVDLKAAPAPVKSEEGSVNKKNVVANNSGAAGMQGKPVAAATGEEKGRTAPGTKDLIGDFQNKAGTSMKDQKPATKPVTTQAAGVNARTPFPKG